MIQIISGVKGKGKTKYLIQKANDEVKQANGNVVYLDKNNKHMYELSNRIRLINLSEYPLDTYDAFLKYDKALNNLQKKMQQLGYNNATQIVSFEE